ncbi:MAG: excinuclease ABC subunit UvrA, partial [Clostridium sp.]
ELSKRSTGKTLYILDEPTTGLHTDDVSRLIEIMQRLVDTGNTIVVIEHNLDVIKCADYLIDLGPEGGEKGGSILAIGTPEDIVNCQVSYTGQYLKKML